MNNFHQKILEARIRENNRKWLGKQISSGIFTGVLIFILFSVLFSSTDSSKKTTPSPSTTEITNIEQSTHKQAAVSTVAPVERATSANVVVSTIENTLSEGFEHFEVIYNENRNILTVNVASDGLAASMIEIKNAGYDENFSTWVEIKGVILMLHNELSVYLANVGYEDTNLIVQLVNDDAYIREDYSTIRYNPLFSVSSISLKAGSYIYDMME